MISGNYNKEIEYAHVDTNFPFWQYPAKHCIGHTQNACPCNTTPVMLPYKKYLLLTNETLIKPTAPAKRQMLW